MEQGIKLINTGFDKPIEQRAIYRPVKIKPSAPISDAMHEQLDCVLARDKDNLRFKDCITDTVEYLSPLPHTGEAADTVQPGKEIPHQHPQIQRQKHLEG